MSKFTATSLKLFICITFIISFANETGLMIQTFTWFAALYALVNIIRLNNLADIPTKGDK